MQKNLFKKMKNEFIKAIISINIKKNIRDLLVDLSKNNQGRQAWLSFWQKGKCVTTNEVRSRRGCVKRKMVKTGITDDADSRVPKRAGMKLNFSQRKGIPS